MRSLNGTTVPAVEEVVAGHCPQCVIAVVAADGVIRVLGVHSIDASWFVL
jgi:hypothetical protein